MFNMYFAGVIKKYSNFVGSPIYLNGQKANDIQPLWLLDPKEVKMVNNFV